MEDRTINIMLIAKRCGSIGSMKYNIARYMSEECNCPIEVYDHRALHSIVKNAFLDFCRSADKIHLVSAMRNFLELDGSDLDRMILSLGLTQVASIDDNGSVFYINGWHDTEFTEKIDKGEWLVSLEKPAQRILSIDTINKYKKSDGMLAKGFLNIMNTAAEKIPAEKLMMLPMLLLTIDTETWKFPPQFKSTTNREVIDFIENSDELKSIFQKKKN